VQLNPSNARDRPGADWKKSTPPSAVTTGGGPHKLKKLGISGSPFVNPDENDLGKTLDTLVQQRSVAHVAVPVGKAA